MFFRSVVTYLPNSTRAYLRRRYNLGACRSDNIKSHNAVYFCHTFHTKKWGPASALVSGLWWLSPQRQNVGMNQNHSSPSKTEKKCLVEFTYTLQYFVIKHRSNYISHMMTMTGFSVAVSVITGPSVTYAY